MVTYLENYELCLKAYILEFVGINIIVIFIYILVVQGHGFKDQGKINLNTRVYQNIVDIDLMSILI